MYGYVYIYIFIYVYKLAAEILQFSFHFASHIKDVQLIILFTIDILGTSSTIDTSELQMLHNAERTIRILSVVA